ncbi:MAG: hypothetical protein E7559_05215 [Ruminococcaceae bacterium]|nr:hypothetical protein [Oscillospiraceae bacterium]
MAGKRPVNLPRTPLNGPLAADINLLDPTVRGGKVPSKGQQTDEENTASRTDDDGELYGYEDSGEGFDGEDSDDDGQYPPTLTDRIVSGVSTALSMLLLGGSVVFWWVLLRHLISSPFNLADPVLMRLLLISCALCPLAATVVQKLLRRPINIERWLISMCVSGVLATLVVTFTKLVIWHQPFSFSDLSVMLCCSVSGCALPAALYMGIRWLLERFAEKSAVSAGDWEQIKRDVSSLSDFDL